MTDQLRRDEPSWSMNAKVAFVVSVSVLFAVTIEASADEPYIPAFTSSGTLSLFQHPGPVMLRILTLWMVAAVTAGAPSYYRRRLAGPQWVREVFVAMTAVYAIGIGLVLVLGPIVRSAVLGEAQPWDWTGSASTHTWIPRSARLLVACLLGGILGIFWAWVLNWTPARVPRKRPFVKMTPPNE